jgi:hypothetical protein
LELSLCLRLKHQSAAAQDGQQEPAARLQQRALFGAKLGSASTPGEQPVCNHCRNSSLQPDARNALQLDSNWSIDQVATCLHCVRSSEPSGKRCLRSFLKWKPGFCTKCFCAAHLVCPLQRRLQHR